MQLFWTYSLPGASNYARNKNYWTYVRSIKVCTEPALLLLGVSTYARSNHYSRGVFARSIKVCIEQLARSIKVCTEQPPLDVHVYTRSTKVCTEQPNVAVYVCSEHQSMHGTAIIRRIMLGTSEYARSWGIHGLHHSINYRHFPHI